MIENMIEYAQSDLSAFERYKKIVYNNKIMFNDKLYLLIKLSDEYKQKKSDK